MKTLTGQKVTIMNMIDNEDNDSGNIILIDKDLKKSLPYSPQEGEYVIVPLATKKQSSLYIGKILEERNDALELYVSFLRRKPGTQKFLMPNKPDLSIVKEDDVKFILPKPLMVGTASRPFYYFPTDFSFLTIN